MINVQPKSGSVSSGEQKDFFHVWNSKSFYYYVTHKKFLCINLRLCSILFCRISLIPLVNLELFGICISRAISLLSVSLHGFSANVCKLKLY